MTAHRSYTVTERGGCVLVFGGVPVEIFHALSKQLPKGAVLNPHVARLAQANFAMGMPDALDALKAELEPEARRRIEEWPRAEGLSPEAREWLAVGQQGASSLAAFLAMTGVRPPALLSGNDREHPTDPGDLRRFLGLIDSVPELRDRLDRLPDLSPQWSILVEHYEELRALLMEEIGADLEAGGAAPRTFQRMRDLRL